MAMKDFLPVGLKGMLLVAFLAAYMSTISTQLNWGSSYLVSDLYKRFLKPENKFNTSDEAQKHYVNIGRLATLASMGIALFATTQISTISGVWTFIIECGAGLGLVLILRWYWWRINAWSEISATLAPFVGYAVSKFILGFEFPNSFFLTVGFTTVTWLIVTFITQPEKKETLSAFYKKVKPLGNWKPFVSEEQVKFRKNRLWQLVMAWLLAITMTYSILFLTGYTIFREWDSALTWLAIALISGIPLIRLIRKANIFDEN